MKQGIKKAVVGILAVSMVVSVGAVSAFAAGTGRNFADADGNGVCDNYSVEQTVSRAAGALQKGSGQNFVDADNDGICDNYAVGQATGQETASSLNRGQNYVDEDNDGVCDNYDPSRTTGRGKGVQTAMASAIIWGQGKEGNIAEDAINKQVWIQCGASRR